MNLNNIELQSRTVTWMRFILAVMVVFIHIPHHTQFGLILCDDFCRLSVPAFFLISGYYFFLHFETWNTTLWLDKLKKRVFTILIPFILWNIIAMAQYVLRALIVKEPFSFAQMYAERGIFIDYPLWFLRDIVLMSLLAPLVYFIVKKFGIWFFVAMMAFPLIGIWTSREILTYNAVLFFILGAYLQINELDIISSFRKLGWQSLCIYIAMVFIARVVCPLNPVLTGAYRYLLVLSGVVTLFWVSGCLVETGTVKVNNHLSNSSFFIFASHAIVLGSVAAAVGKFLPGTSSGFLVARGAIIWFGTVALCLAVYELMNRLLPKVTTVLNGKRVK